MAFITTTADNISSGGTITGDLTISGDLTVEGGGGFSYSEVLTGDMKITNTAATVGLEIAQSGAETALFINQDADNKSILIDSEATTSNIIHFLAPATTTAYGIMLDDMDSLTTGGGMQIKSNSSSTGTRSLLKIVNDNTAATGATGLYIQQDSTGQALHIISPTDSSMTIEGEGARSDANTPRAHLNFVRDVTSGTVANDDVAAIVQVQATDAGGNDGYITEIQYLTSTATAGSVVSDVVWKTVQGAGIGTRTEAMRIQGGKIGIGTASPASFKLDVVHDISGSVDGIANIFNPSLADGQYIYYRLGKASSTNNSGLIGYSQESSASRLWLSNYGDAGASGVGLSVQKGGNVGIGSATPTHGKLEIVGATDAFQLVMSDVADADDTIKEVRMGMMHYKQAEEPVTLMYAQSGSSTNSIYIGGGTGSGNHATSISLATASTYNSTSTTVNMIVDNNSRISLSNNDSDNTSNTIFGKSCWNNSSNNGSDFNTIFGEGVMGTGAVAGATYNTAMGAGALIDITNGDTNTAMGADAFANLTEGSDNVGLGTGAGELLTTANKVVFIGRNAGAAVTVTNSAESDGTVAVGHSALGALTSGQGNVAVGYQSLDAEDDGDFSTAVGYQALTAQTGTSGNVGNTAVGYQTALAMTKGRYNVALGWKALYTEDVGDVSTAVGTQALYSQNSDSDNEDAANTGIGKAAGYYNVTGQNNVYVGRHAGFGVSGKSHSNCVYIGKDAGLTAYTGAGNIAIGASAMDDTDAGTTSGASENNIFVGFHAGGGTWANTQTDNAVALGAYALYGALDNVDGTVAIGGNALQQLTSGGYNTAVGYSALSGVTTGAGNVAMGYGAADAFGLGEELNVAIGYNAMGAVDEGDNTQTADSNVAIGYNALFGGILANTKDLVGNIAIGSGAMDSTGTNAQTGTIAIGQSALTALTSGAKNIAIGYDAMGDLTEGSNNIAIGYDAMNRIGSEESPEHDNIAIGVDAMGNAYAGTETTDDRYQNNIAIGTEALNAYSGGASAYYLNGNVAIGYQAAKMTATANSQTGVVAIGNKALTALTSGQANTAIGANAGLIITSGERNVILGYGALDAGSTEVDDNVAIGFNAMGGAIGTEQVNDCVAIGSGALAGALDSTDGADEASGTVAIGKSALAALTSGASNTAVGYQAAQEMTTGAKNTAIGYGAMLNSDGAEDDCTCVGYLAGDTIDNGAQNTVIGSIADVSTGIGNNQTVIGYGTTGVANDSVTLGNASVTAVYMGQDGADGTGATVYAKSFDLRANSGGGHPNAYMTNHVADSEGATFQFRKSRNTTAGSHTIVQDNDQIGNLTWYASDGNSWERAGVIQCLIDGTPGDGDIPTEMLFGVAPDGATTSTTRLTIAPAGTVSGDLNDTSDVGLKENIKTIEAGLTIVNQLNPVTFDWKQGSRGSNSGFIAQEIEKILPNDVCGKDYIEPEEGEQAENMGKSINVTGIVAHLVKAVQELTAKVEALENK
jgi:hypothetical protein